MRGDEVLDAAGRVVEAPGEPPHLVVPLHLHAGRQVSGAERFDSRLKAFQPSGQTAHHRIGANSDGERDQREHEEQAHAWMPVVVPDARDQHAAVGQTEGPARRRRSAPGAQPWSSLPARIRRSQRGANNGERRAIRRKQRYVRL